MKKEPAVLIAALVAVLQGVVIFLTEDTAVDAASVEAWLLPLVTILGGLWTRRQVFAPATLERAGLEPEVVERNAERKRL